MHAVTRKMLQQTEGALSTVSKVIHSRQSVFHSTDESGVGNEQSLRVYNTALQCESKKNQ